MKKLIALLLIAVSIYAQPTERDVRIFISTAIITTSVPAINYYFEIQDNIKSLKTYPERKKLNNQANIYLSSIIVLNYFNILNMQISKGLRLEQTGNKVQLSFRF